MNKEQLLRELSIKIVAGEISYDEIQKLAIADKIDTTKTSSHFTITKLFYMIGAVIALLGVVLFTFQVWSDIGSAIRVIITLGMGLMVTAIGISLHKNKTHEDIATAFYFIGGMLIPGGAMVLLSEFGPDPIGQWSIAISFGVISLFYLIINYVNKNVVLTFFTIANATALIYTITSAILSKSYFIYGDTSIYTYLTMAVGISYILLSTSFKDTFNHKLIGALNFFGITGLLGAGFSKIYDSGLWQAFFLLLVTAGFVSSVYLKSRIILIMSTLFLLAFVTYITGKYFADSIGWPVSLVILGFIFIGLGYGSIRISKKYITNQ